MNDGADGEIRYRQFAHLGHDFVGAVRKGFLTGQEAMAEAQGLRPYYFATDVGDLHQLDQIRSGVALAFEET